MNVLPISHPEESWPGPEYPGLSALTNQIDDFLQKKHPDFFGSSPERPILPLKRFKVVHDNLWGTNRFGWRELALIDSPVVQRLRDIHQVGLAFQVYPSALHTRFEHCLGAATLASRILDAILERQGGEVRDIAKAVAPTETPSVAISRMRQELRLAALLHDVGHSLFSHTSEKVYRELGSLKAAAEELTRLVGKTKGAGEAISFCVAGSKSIAGLLQRAKDRLLGEPSSEDYQGDIDLTNIALMIVGRARHPFLQFLGDIVSSGFDADKLDYLLRDATAAGLPLRYDIDRYLYSVRLERQVLLDGEGELERLYESVGTKSVERYSGGSASRLPYYDTYRLRLPREAMNTIEQIVISKLMLYSYIYHHSKVRAAEGMLTRILKRLVQSWREAGESDMEIIEHFLELTDSALRGPLGLDSSDDLVKKYSYSIVNRLLPREVYRFGGAIATHAEKPLLTDFLLTLQDKERRDALVQKLEQAIGEELVGLDGSLGSTPDEALWRAGVWVDVPMAPRFEDVHELVVGGTGEASGVEIAKLFPIDEWTQAYTHFRYYVRIYSFSEHLEKVLRAGKRGMQKISGIESDAFYMRAQRRRS